LRQRQSCRARALLHLSPLESSTRLPIAWDSIFSPWPKYIPFPSSFYIPILIILQKAAKNLTVRNAARLQQTHLITLAINSVFLLLRFTFRRSLSLKSYVCFSLPGAIIEFYLDRVARPTYSADGTIRHGGEDLGAEGLTEFMWDVLYWTWINVILVIILGNRAWWLYLVVPGYAIYAAITTASGLKGMLSGMSGAGAGGDAEGAGSASQSKRQAKLEKRGGQRVAYR
jgi:hypothetical protein